MAEQYFTADPTCESKQVPCSFVYRGHGLNFMTDAGVFSKGELDTGTRLLLDALPDVYGDVLDLGCGWGAIGVAVKKSIPPRMSRWWMSIAVRWNCAASTRCATAPRRNALNPTAWRR